MRSTIQHAVDVCALAMTALAVGILAVYTSSCIGGWEEPCGDGYCLNGYICNDGDECIPSPIAKECGNLIVGDSSGEVCDDGNNENGDGCSADCKSRETCGNSMTDTFMGEVCDDGNEEDGDGCSADCTSDETCGNEIEDVDEVCDDGNEVGGDGCSADCKSLETCGNEVIDVDEVCDDGNQDDGDGCSANCKSLETCGNGIVDHVKGEVCDDGNDENGDGCSANCKSLETCGNDIEDVGEVCDDGNQDDGDGCSANCKSDETCGNGIVDHFTGEECDDGNTDNLDSCSANCRSSADCLAEGVYDGRSYMLCRDLLSWQQAVEDCGTRGMQLVTIRDQAENDFVFDLARSHIDSGAIWLGANDMDTEGEWKWVDDDDDTVSFTCAAQSPYPCEGGFSNWNTNEPNNVRGGNEHCAVMRAGTDAGGNWNDTLCDLLGVQYVCESV